MPGALEGLGSIAGNFAQGYRQARQQKTQESLQEQQMQFERANMLFKLADQYNDTNDPTSKLRDTLHSSATQIVDSLDKPVKKDPKGLGAMIGQLFGIGHHVQSPASGTGQPAEPPKPPEFGTAPAAAGPESQTYGGLGEMLGAAIQKPEAAPAAASMPVIPPVPQVDMSGMPTTKEMQSAAVPFQPPTLQSPRGTPVTPPVATSPAAPSVPSGGPVGTAVSSTGHNIPMARDVIAHAMEAADKAFPVVPGQFAGGQRGMAARKAAQDAAMSNTQAMLNETLKYITANPGIHTIQDASRDPIHGQDFQAFMSAIADYEFHGLVDPKVLSDFQKRVFETGTPYNSNAEPPTIADAFGNRFMKGADGRYTIPATPGAETKKPEAITLKQAADAAFLVPEAQRTTTDLGTIKSYFDEMARADRAKLSPTDQVQWDWLKANEAVPIQKKAETFQGLFHPVQPTQPIVFNSTNPVTNRTETSLLNRGTAGITPIPGAQGPGKTFNAEQYMRPYQPPAVKNAAGRMETPPATKLYDPDQLINSHRGGDEAVSVDTLRDLIKDPTKFPPGGVKQIEDYIASLPGPYPVLGQKK